MPAIRAVLGDLRRKCSTFSKFKSIKLVFQVRPKLAEAYANLVKIPNSGVRRIIGEIYGRSSRFKFVFKREQTERCDSLMLNGGN